MSKGAGGKKIRYQCIECGEVRRTMVPVPLYCSDECRKRHKERNERD